MEQKIGCLVIHGFGGSYREIAPLAEALKEKNIIINCPRLKGHTGIVKDLNNVSYNDWIESAEAELFCLKEQCQHVFVAGFSMGGLIGMHLSMKHQVDGLITINTPIYYLDFPQIISNIVSDISTWKFNNIKRYLKPSNRLPLKALWNFQLLLRNTKKLVSELKVPIMIAQAIDDDVVQHRSAGYIYSNAGSPVKKLSTYTQGGHVILLSESAHSLIIDIMHFLQERSGLATGSLSVS